jgi:diguanylate cyclase (GGDEF)-like protein
VANLERASAHDALTGLINRHHMQALLDEEVRRLRRTEQAFCLAIIDLDHFKQINDRHGHAVGDAVLQRPSPRWPSHPARTPTAWHAGAAKSSCC